MDVCAAQNHTRIIAKEPYMKPSEFSWFTSDWMDSAETWQDMHL